MNESDSGLSNKGIAAKKLLPKVNFSKYILDTKSRRF